MLHKRDAGPHAEYSKLRLLGQVTALSLTLSMALVCPASPEIIPPPSDLSQESFVSAFQTLYDYYSIHYPFTEHKGIDWPGLFDIYMPRIAAAQAARDTASYRMSVRRFVHSFPDGHVRVSGDYGDLYRPEIGGGFGVTLVELDDGTVVAGQVRPDGPAAQAGVRRGAAITEWNGQAIEAAVAQADIIWEGQPPSTESSRQLARLRRLVRAPVGAGVSMVFANPGLPAARANMTAVDDTLATWEKTRFTVFGTDGQPMFDPNDLFDPVRYDVLPSGYGYLRSTVLIEVDSEGNITGSYDNIVAELLAAIDAFNAAQVAGVIVDVRDNPGGFDALAALFGGLFFDRIEVYEHASFYDDDAASFLVLPDFTLHLEPQAAYFGGPVVCLVNAGTASSAEGVAMAIQRLPRSRVVGVEGTHGSFGLTGGGTLLPGGLTVAFPHGRSLDAAMRIQLDSDASLSGGVEPDLYVPIDQTAVEAWFGDGTDIVLAYAEAVLAGISAVEPSDGQGRIEPRLLNSFPNPFNPSTTISFRMPQSAAASLGIYDLSGRLVRTLIDAEVVAAGRHEREWWGRDDAGRTVASGLYLFRLDAGGHSETKRVTLLK